MSLYVSASLRFHTCHNATGHSNAVMSNCYSSFCRLQGWIWLGWGFDALSVRKMDWEVVSELQHGFLVAILSLCIANKGAVSTHRSGLVI